MIYLIHTGPTRLSRRSRACGWHHITLDKKGCQALRDLVQPLKDRRIRRIYADDQHDVDAHVVAQALDIPNDQVFTCFELRPFNVGRNHGKPEGAIEIILADELLPKWAKNPDVPMRGGDSWSSYHKRFITFVEKHLLDSDTGDVVLLTDSRGVRTIRDPWPESLLATSAAIRADRIYLVKRHADSASN